MGNVRASENAKTLVRDGKPFIPWGTTYFRPGMGWSPQVWKRHDPAHVEEDFARLAALGVNVARVFCTWRSFVESEEKVNEEGFSKLDSFLKIAGRHGVMVQPTGPTNWEGPPGFARGERSYVASGPLLRAAENYWRELASRYKDDERVFSYALQNEPEVYPNEEFWAEWEKIARAKGKGDKKRWPTKPRHRWHLGDVCDEARLEFERLRNRFADGWMRRMCDAIRSTGTTTPVTCGYRQFSFPFIEASSGFHLSGGAKLLDFVTIHYYPGAVSDPVVYRFMLDQGALWASYAAFFGVPVVLGEFGWMGGNERPFLDRGGCAIFPPASEELSAVWSRDLVHATRPFASGWLNWGAYDMPEARDCTRHTGMLAADGRAKAWGEMFRAMAPHVAEFRPAEALPVREFDPAPLVTGGADRYGELEKVVLERRARGDFLLKEAEG